MNTQIFVNLPVSNLPKSRSFFSELGYSFNEQYSNDKAACLVISKDIFVMLLVKDFFQTFTKKSIADSTTTVEVMNALSLETKEQVNALADKALSIGGKPGNETQDYGWMYSRSFEDLDGHIWELFYTDPAGMPG